MLIATPLSVYTTASGEDKPAEAITANFPVIMECLLSEERSSRPGFPVRHIAESRT